MGLSTRLLGLDDSVIEDGFVDSSGLFSSSGDIELNWVFSLSNTASSLPLKLIKANTLLQYRYQDDLLLVGQNALLHVYIHETFQYQNLS